MLYALFQLLKDSLDYEFKFSGIHLTDYDLETTLFKGNLGKVDILLNSVTIKDVALELKHGQLDNSIEVVEAVENLSKPRELKSPKLNHEAEISPAEEGINDMSKIIQSIINSVSITVENVDINLGLISIHVDKIELKSSEIPSKLYIQENLLVNLIKYFYISGINLQFNGIKMLKVGQGWVRLMFLQSLEESAHQAAELINDRQKMMQSFIVGESPPDSKSSLPSISGGLKDSILDANMELMISIDECLGISNVKLILELLGEIGSLSPTKPKSENGQQSPKILVELGKMKLLLLPFKVVPDYEQLFGSNDLPKESLDLQLTEITITNSQDNGISTLLLSCDGIDMKESGLQLLSLTGQFEPALSFRVVKLRNNLHSKMYLNLKAVKMDAIFNEILEYKSKYIGDLNQVNKTKTTEKQPNSYLELHIEDIEFNMHFNGENDTKSIRIIAQNGFSVLGDSTDSPTLQLSQCSLFTNAPDPEKLLTSSKIKFRFSVNPKASDNHYYCDERFISKRHEIARKSNESDQLSSTSWSDSEDISPALNAERIDDISLLSIRYLLSLSISNFKIEATNHHIEYLKDVSKYIETATLGMSLDTQQPLIKFQLAIEFGSIFGNSILTPDHILLTFKSLLLDLYLNSLDDFRNLTHMELGLKEFDLKILDKELNRDALLRIQRRLGGNFKEMLNVLVTIDSDAELLTQHTTLTINFCECYAAVFDRFEYLTTLRSETESSLVSSSIDLALQIYQSEVLKSFGKKTLMLELLRAKINSMFIIGSPTISVTIEPSSCFLFLSHLFSPECITKEGDRKTLLQSCGFVNVAQLSGLSAIIRINKSDGVNPSENIEVYFKKLQLLGCKDAFFSLIDIISEWKGGETKAPGKETSLASNVDELVPVDTFEMIEEYVFHSVEKVSTEDELDWQMNFDSSESREENIRAKVTSYPTAETFQLQTNYLDQLEPILPYEDLEVPRLKYTIRGQAISWMIYEGYDFDPLDQTVSERGSHQAELLLQDLDIGIKIYPSTSLLTKLLEVSVKEVEILDNVSTSHWRKLLTYQIPGPMDPPRETNSSMLTYRWKGVRSNNNEEFILELGILPLQLYIDQDTFSCLEHFFTREGKRPATEEMEVDKQQTNSSEKMVFFQKIEIEPLVIQLDYKPKRVDITRISHGQLAELFNFLNIDGANIYLKPVSLVGIHGWQRFFSKVSSIWIPHIKNTQIPQVASGVAGIKSFVTLGGGISDLILLPIEQYRKDGRIIRGISRGANAFIRAASVESTRIVSRIATGAQTLIETAENGINPSRSSVSKLAEQPKDIIEGAQLGLRALNLSVQDAARTLKMSNTEGGNQAQAVPIALLQPVKGVATAIAQLLVGIHNTLDETQQLRMRNKYKLQ